MTAPDAADKWDQRYANANHASLHAAQVLADNSHLLPARGKALDLACGLGANALFLAKQGLQTCAWDISQTALDKLKTHCLDMAVELELEMRDVTVRPPAANSFDVIVVSRFLHRPLFPFLVDALKMDGLIFYQTFIREMTGDSGPRNLEYRLGCNELLQLFRELQLLHYREEGTTGNINQGFRNEAMLIAKKSRV